MSTQFCNANALGAPLRYSSGNSSRTHRSRLRRRVAASQVHVLDRRQLVVLRTLLLFAESKHVQQSDSFVFVRSRGRSKQTIRMLGVSRKLSRCLLDVGSDCRRHFTADHARARHVSSVQPQIEDTHRSANLHTFADTYELTTSLMARCETVATLYTSISLGRTKLGGRPTLWSRQRPRRSRREPTASLCRQCANLPKIRYCSH